MVRQEVGRGRTKTVTSSDKMHRSALVWCPLLLGVAVEVHSHGAVTFPPSRNAIDADIFPGNATVFNLPMPFEFYCPMPSASAAPPADCASQVPVQAGRGGGGTNYPQATATYQECQAACCADERCIEWNWDSNLTAAFRPPQCRGTGGCCWLKTAAANPEGPVR
eukprot:SAG11_NODE_6_length_32111_cov_33.703174_16_plen_165_part_00